MKTVKTVKTPPISQRDAAWFRDQHRLALDEIRALHAAIERFCHDLDVGLTGSLIARELRNRIKAIPSRI